MKSRSPCLEGSGREKRRKGRKGRTQKQNTHKVRDNVGRTTIVNVKHRIAPNIEEGTTVLCLYITTGT
jgi:uncharacterized protein YeeX (DUF496 family)